MDWWWVGGTEGEVLSMGNFKWSQALAVVLGLAASGCGNAVPPARQVGPGSASSGTAASDPAQGTASAPPAVEGRAAEDALPSGRSGAATRAPPPLPGARGRLPAEVIRSAIRNNFGRFQRCYEQGLARDPKLTGSVTVRFVIAEDGKASDVSNLGSDLPDAEVVNCVMEVYSGLYFPQPEGRITVIYPLRFTPGE